MQRIPLEERLRTAKSASPKACQLNACAYFQALSDMRGDFHYSAVYNSMASVAGFGESTIAQTAADVLSGQYPEEIGMQMLYCMLAEPFADKKIWKTKGAKPK